MVEAAILSGAAARMRLRGLAHCMCGAISHWSGITLTENRVLAAKAAAEEVLKVKL